MSEPESYTIPAGLMNRLYNTLMHYANRTTYDAPRTGGVLAGCPRGAKPTPEQLTWAARWAIREIDRDVLGREQKGEHWPIPAEERNEFDAIVLKLKTIRSLADNAWGQASDAAALDRIVEVCDGSTGGES